MGYAAHDLQPEQRGWARPLRRLRVLAAGVVLVAVGLTSIAALRHTDAGPVLGTVTVGQIPGWVAVDARTNRAFVSNVADHTVSVLDARSGAVLRTIALGGHEPNTLAVDVRTGRVFVLSLPTWTADVLDAATGARLRTVALDTFDLAVDEPTGRVLATGPDPSLGFSTVSVLDGRTGTLLQAHRVSLNVTSAIALDSRTHRAFVTDLDGGVEMIVDTASGRALRTVAVGNSPVQVAVDTRSGRAFVMNDGADTVSVLDARSGAVLRTVRVGPNPARAVVDERTGRVFVVHGRGASADPFVGSLGSFGSFTGTGVTMLDARTGAVLASLPVGGSPVDDIEVLNALNLAVDQRRGRVFVINAPPAVATGSPLTFSNVQSTLGTGGTFLTDQIMAGAATSPREGSVSVLDARSGRLLHTLRVGRHPYALAVNETTARLFVVNTNSGCLRPPRLWDRVPAGVRHALPFLPAPAPPICHMPGTVTVIDTAHL